MIINNLLLINGTGTFVDSIIDIRVVYSNIVLCVRVVFLCCVCAVCVYMRVTAIQGFDCWPVTARDFIRKSALPNFVRLMLAKRFHTNDFTIPA